MRENFSRFFDRPTFFFFFFFFFFPLLLLPLRLLFLNTYHSFFSLFFFIWS